MENSPFHITSSQLTNKDKFRFSNRLQVPNFKPVGASDFQTDFQKRSLGDESYMINNIKLQIRFKDYQFRRVKMMGNNTVIYN